MTTDKTDKNKQIAMFGSVLLMGSSPVRVRFDSHLCVKPLGSQSLDRACTFVDLTVSFLREIIILRKNTLSLRDFKI